MNLKTQEIIWTILTLSILTGNIFAASGRNNPERDEAIEDSNLVSSLGRAKDIEGLEKLADILEKKWSEKNSEYYVAVISAISENFNGNDSYELGDKYAKLALDKLYNLPKDKKVPIEGEFSLLWKINDNIFLPFKHINSLAQEEKWAEKRCESAKYYFRVWERLEKDIDPNWKPMDRNDRTSFIQPPGPPAGYKGPFISGMSPNSIKDPKMRAEYESALKEYWEKMRQNSRQYGLRRIKESDLKSLQNDILKLYSGPSFDSKSLETEALKQDIAKYVEDKKIRTTMLEFMQNRLIEELKPKWKEGFGKFTNPPK